MKNTILLGLLGLLCLVLFRNWLYPGFLASGDWHFFFSHTLSHFVPGVWSWDYSYNNGFGGSDIFLLGLNSYFLNGSFLLMNVFGLQWWFVERIMWFWPFLTIGMLSSYFLYTSFFKDNGWLLAVFLFISNTYTLMLIGGGQVGVAMAFSLSHLVFGLWVRLIKGLKNEEEPQNTLKLILLNGLILGLQICLDLRIAYITIFSLGLFSLFNLSVLLHPRRVVIVCSVFLVSFLLNAFWIIPQSLLKENPIQQLGAAYSSEGAVKFFSFAKFENTIGLLHPNWPENIFGKVGFMKPEFLLLPLFAYASLLFVDRRKENRKYISFFVLLGLIGAFLAKGANEPFGEVYLWMFHHVPGFIMFRDPTKWYLLIVLSYSVLIPFTINSIYVWLHKKVTI